MRTLALTAMLAGTMFATTAPGRAVAQTQLISNGSFENGIADWLVGGGANCGAGAITKFNYHSNNTPSPAGPTAGAYYAQLYPIDSNQTCYLYQDVAIPSGHTTLSFDASTGFSPGASAAQYSGAFRVMTTANVVLDTPFFRDGSQASAWNLASYTADLTPYAGQTVRLAFEMKNGTSCCNVTFGDNVSVLNSHTPAPVPTLSEWAMILLGVALAGGAAVYLQRRETTA
ncbi:IPTL-CTERM sorting domain-containing protein [Brevundimonas diminuta]|nr:IPTL-CTERM sorting domain-containing protein [Brevundimonas diminuta]